MVLVQRGDDGSKVPLTWWKDSGDASRGPAVWLRCPNGHIGTLQDHTIHPTGLVEPSVECPADGCTFHEDDVHLAGWPT